MKTTLPILLAAVMCTGCSQTVATRDPNHKHIAYTRPDYFKKRRTVTGSNIPARSDMVTFGPVSATAPPESLSRERPSLYPTEPVVGATPNSDPGTASSNVGAGPAGSHPVLPGQ